MCCCAREGYTQLASFLRKDGIDLSSVKQNIASAGTARTVLGFVLRGAEVAVIIVITAIYLAAEPEHYHRGMALLFPQSMRAKAVKAVDGVGA